ncbi:MAG: beta-phosphoglucomutase [Ardenticatenaceae bacterium]
MLKAIIFDLDGVLTNTAEFHYQSWERLTKEEGILFSREKNELLRGRRRSESLKLILGDREVTGQHFEEMLERKNRYYLDILSHMPPDYLLPGIPALLDELEAAGIRMGVGSASKNARPVLQQLAIAHRFEVIAGGGAVMHNKPAPDLFLFVARQMGVAPHQCVVVEDAQSGIDAALAGGFAALGIGPHQRVGHAHLRLDDTSGLSLARLREALRRANN